MACRRSGVIAGRYTAFSQTKRKPVMMMIFFIYTRSTTVAMPTPPPPHSICTPARPLVRFR